MMQSTVFKTQILGIEQTCYYRPDELESILQQLAKQFPDLAQLHSIGKSIQGKDIWVMELTNKKTGSGNEKPGEFIFATTHAAEVMGAAVSLYTVCYVVDQYGKESRITNLLDHTVLYVLPYLNPDGAEIALTTPYHWVGNGRYLPGEEVLEDGFYQYDVNDDGLILEMRIESPDGEWKVSKHDPRLLILREPGDTEGPFYQRYPEGLIKNYDGVDFKIPKPQDGNLNRNFPENWGPEYRQYGAGKYATSEPETRAIVDFVIAHPNIVGSLSLHTNEGAILFPEWAAKGTSYKRDEIAFRRLANAGKKLTGYNIIESVLETFTIDKSKPRLGTADDWLYKQMGKICFTVELWNWWKEAGIEKKGFLGSLTGMTEDEGLKLLEWNDVELDGKGFSSWAPFEHPQLGRVEIGGWIYMWPGRNAPPGRLLVKEAHAVTQFTIAMALSAPQLEIKNAKVEQVEKDVYRVSVVAANTGFLPTYGTQLGKEKGISKPVEATLEANEGITVLNNINRVVGHLAGWGERDCPWSQWTLQWDRAKQKLEWLVRADKQRGEVTIVIHSDLAGVVRETIRIG